MNLLACGPALPDVLWLVLRPLLFGATLIGISYGVLRSVTAYLDHAVKKPDPNQYRPRRPRGW
jgi:hypothetical protein